MSLSRFANTVAQSWSRYKLYNQTVRELSRLDDRELADLGIGRNGIQQLAREAIR
ncbi:DUF1127 domain-containing protein [Methyloraptor flagellatus]|jgi:uncharacterized protein YjiS (DUF1127 family)|uniref:DUF1127 domain-containing protein n=1 Tax=Methyloraptor flagellatus TaxID=3162530 RepID=A0AAU7X7H9_9HYPH